MVLQAVKSFERKYNWLISSFVVHGIIVYALTGEPLAVLAAVAISLDHAWILKKSPRKLENILDNLTHPRAKDKRDFLHKTPVLVVSAIAFVFFRAFVFDKLIYLISLGIFIHLLQDFLEDYLFFDDIRGWRY